MNTLAIIEAADPKLASNLKWDGECLIYTGARTGTGYGNPCRVIDGRKVYPGAHRLVWMLVGRELIPGLVLDHICRNRACANPDHLRQVTQRENVLAGDSPSAKHAAKTACPQGHPYDSENTYIWRGQRRCRICNTEAQRRLRT